MFIPALLVGGGVLLIAALRARQDAEGEPAAPIPLPPLPPAEMPALPAAPGSPAVPAKTFTPDESEVEALARVIASEAGSGTDAEKRGIGWTVRNRFRGGSIRNGAGKSAGEFPWRSQKGSDPPFSSARPATSASTAMAREILSAPWEADPTGGSTAFFEPKMQDVFAKAGALARAGETGDRVIDGVKLTDITRFKAYRKDADTIRKSWGNGSALYAVAGRFELWGSATLFAKRGGTVQTLVGVSAPFDDIVDPLDALKG